MCGIAGIFSIDQQDPDILKNSVKTMANAIAHRGPDDSGVWSNNLSIALGHRRLSIIDTSTLGHQPMSSTNGRFIISYNGEIYNHQLLRNMVL
ncbi:asparagine synthetase B, partial [Gammaproteobacteria bacterium]|nr:asparagine synthetase B [Gammaproteobacteria bacterium]